MPRLSRAILIALSATAATVLIAHAPSSADSEAGSESGGAFDSGAGSDSGGILRAGGYSESGGIYGSAAYSQSGGVYNSGAYSESGGIYGSAAYSQSGGPLATGAYSASGGVNIPGIYRPYGRYRSYLWRNYNGDRNYRPAQTYYRLPPVQHVPELEVKNYSWPSEPAGTGSPPPGAALADAGKSGAPVESPQKEPGGQKPESHRVAQAIFPLRQRGPAQAYPATYAEAQHTRWLRAAAFPMRSNRMEN